MRENPKPPGLLHYTLACYWSLANNASKALEELAAAIRPDTVLVSIMTANNETGVLQPMEEISVVCRQTGVLLHSDMVQSFGKTPTALSVVDAASFAALRPAIAHFGPFPL